MRIGKAALYQLDDVADLGDGLRRLGGYADARMRLEQQHVLVVQDDVEVIKVAGQAAHFDMAALPDDHRVIAVAHKRPDRLVRDVDQRARSLHDFKSKRTRTRQGALGRAVRGHHDCGRLDVGDVVGDGDASRS